MQHSLVRDFQILIANPECVPNYTSWFVDASIIAGISAIITNTPLSWVVSGVDIAIYNRLFHSYFVRFCISTAKELDIFCLCIKKNKAILEKAELVVASNRDVVTVRSAH